MMQWAKAGNTSTASYSVQVKVYCMQEDVNVGRCSNYVTNKSNF